MDKKEKEVIEAKYRVLGIFKLAELIVAILIIYHVLMYAFHSFVGYLVRHTGKEPVIEEFYYIAIIACLWYSIDLAIRLVYQMTAKNFFKELFGLKKP